MSPQIFSSSTRSPQEARASSCPSATSHSTAPAVWCRTKGYCSLHQAPLRVQTVIRNARVTNCVRSYHRKLTSEPRECKSPLLIPWKFRSSFYWQKVAASASCWWRSLLSGSCNQPPGPIGWANVDLQEEGHGRVAVPDGRGRRGCPSQGHMPRRAAIRDLLITSTHNPPATTLSFTTPHPAATLHPP